MLRKNNHWGASEAGTSVAVGARAYSIAPLQWRVLDGNAPIMVENGKIGAQWNKPGRQPSVNRQLLSPTVFQEGERARTVGTPFMASVNSLRRIMSH
jgi:hypothetical protein